LPTRQPHDTGEARGSVSSILARIRQRASEDGVTGLPRRLWRWVSWKVRRARRRLRPPSAPIHLRPANHRPPPICSDLRGWCSTQADAVYEVIVEPRHIIRSPPRTTEPTVHEVFEKYYAVDAPEHAVVGVGRASIATNGLIFLPDGALVGDMVTHALEFRDAILASEPAYTHPLTGKRRELSGNCYSLVIGNYPNYYHWQQDVMMRLPAVLPHLPPRTRFIVPPGLQEFHHAMLDAVDLGDAEFCVRPHDEVWTCERLYFCTPYLKPILHAPEFMRAFVDRCLRAYGITERHPTECIFISRRHDNHWRTSNEPEVIGLLERYGFESHDLARLSFEQQVSLFSQAKVIVGTGAGLSNMIFAPPGATILQFQDPNHPVGHHFTISTAMGHVYWYFFGAVVANPGSRYGRGDIHVPLDKLRDCLERALG
jgi:Glycosyltransferase 61